MSDSRDTPADAPLNPALKRRTETAYDTRTSTPAPIDTTSAKEGQGEGWPWIWLVIVAGCLAVTAWLIF